MDSKKFENTILYVEDDDSVRENYISYLSRFCEKVYEASNAEDAYEIYKMKKPDILILDINLPKRSGIALLQDIRKFDHSVRAIMLTAMSDVETLVSASELKLTKYLIKPISRDELKDALNLAINEKINYTIHANKIIHIKDSYYWDQDKKKLIYKDKEMVLTRKERELLALLFLNVNKIFDSDEIIYELWYDYDISKLSSLKTLIKALRKKLPKGTIKNIFGIGYKIEI